MKLPEIDDTAPVQDVSSGFAKMGASQEKASDTFQQGLDAYGQEMVRAQHDKASSQLLSGLDQAQIDLRENKTISTQDLKNELGADYDKLPPEVKEQTQKTIPTDVSSGAGVAGEKVDRNDIPMYSVAGYIFDARAKKILGDAASNLTSDGWRSEFVTKAANEITTNKLKLSKFMLHDMHEDLQTKDLQSAIDYANAGRSDLARNVLASSKSMDYNIKDQALSHVDKIEQTLPLYQHLRTGDIGGMLRDQKMLDDPNQLTKLSGDERLAFTNRIEAEVNKFQREIKSSDNDKLKATAEAGWNGIFSKERDGAPVDLSDIPMPGTVKAEDQKEMIKYVNGLNKQERPETDMKVYAGLTDMAAKDRTGFGKVQLFSYRNQLSDSDFKHFVDLQTGMKGGNPEAYDHFVNTNEAIDAQLMAPQYGINAENKKDKDVQKKVGYLKSIVQHDLADAQQNNGGKPLGLDERDGIIAQSIKSNIDPRKSRMLWWDKSASFLPYDAGIPPMMAASFQKAVMRQNPMVMGGTDSDAKIKELTTKYTDFQNYEGYINRSWKVLSGRNVSPDMAVKVWDKISSDRSRLQGILKRDGGFTPDDALNEERITSLAADEVHRGQ